MIWVCVAWSVETLVLLFTPPLIIVQLGVIWGAWFLLDKIEGKNIAIIELEKRIIDEKPIKVKTVIRSIPEEEKKLLQGVGHKKFLHDSVKESKETLIILSGWITEYVVTDDFLQMLEDALKRRVKVYIGYGWKDSRGIHSPFGGSKKVVKKLKEMIGKYPNNLFIAKFANHEKVLVKDDYVVYGSNNWLSNSKFNNSERSIVLHSPGLADIEKDRIIGIVKSELIDV